MLNVPLPPRILPPILPRLPRKSASTTAWIIAATCAVAFVFVLVAAFALLLNKETPQQRTEAELKRHLSTFRETFSLGSYDLVLDEKNTLVNYCRENKTSLTNFASELNEICSDLDNAIVPWREDVPETEFQRRADVTKRAIDNIAILIERLSHDNERLKRAKDWKASQDVERAK